MHSSEPARPVLSQQVQMKDWSSGRQPRSKQRGRGRKGWWPEQMRGNVGGLGRRTRHRGSAWLLLLQMLFVSLHTTLHSIRNPPKGMDTMALGWSTRFFKKMIIKTNNITIFSGTLTVKNMLHLIHLIWRKLLQQAVLVFFSQPSCLLLTATSLLEPINTSRAKQRNASSTANPALGQHWWFIFNSQN